MKNIELQIKNQLEHCSLQKQLDSKTIKAYRIDLTRFINQISETQLDNITRNTLELYFYHFCQNYRPNSEK